MTLSKHVSFSEVEKGALGKTHKTPLNEKEEFVSDYDANRLLPKFEIPAKSSDSNLIYKYLNEELTLDGNPTLNLASFVNTEISSNAAKLAKENIVKNLADNDEYPSLIEFQQRCITMLSNLWHAPTHYNESLGRKAPNSIGTACTGSSEAIMLGGLAMKKTWQAKRKQQGKSIENPNILMASCAQVALEKFASYFDVENRLISITEESGHLLDLSKIKENVDENTIGIFVIMGSTFTGAFEPVWEVNTLLDEIEKETGLDIPIHVDGASGAFVAPFVYPHLKWDFLLSRVVSINTSGHKFGLTSAGLGWIIWKDQQYLPESLRFKLDYLGGIEETFNLNFSRPGYQVIQQYYNLLSFGREGYTKMFEGTINNARLLSDFLIGTGFFEVLSVIHKPLKQGIYKDSDAKTYDEKFMPGLPVVAFRFCKEFRDKYPEVPQSILSLLLRNKGFIIPNYHLTPAEHEKEILRVVVRTDMSLNLLEKLMQDIVNSTELLVKSCDSVRKLITTKQSEKLDEKLVYELLMSIASNGVADLKEVQKIFDKPGTGHHKNKNSYRGAC